LLTDADRWILDRCSEVIGQVSAKFDGYEFAKLAEDLYHFAWDDFCDWYVELAKVALNSGDEALARNTRAVLGSVLDVLLRLLHPLMPFITETLWTALTGGESLVIAAWPHTGCAPSDQRAAGRIADLQHLVREVRRFRADQGLKPGQRVAARLSTMEEVSLTSLEPAVRSLARLRVPEADFTPSVSLEVALSGGLLRVEIDLSGAVDLAAERARLDKDLAVAQKELKQCEAKLGNPKFLANAPDSVVEGITARRATALADIDRITARLSAMPTA
ncbi:MAG: class I tRNA ligase family protein, partial [Sciscionella sp.]